MLKFSRAGSVLTGAFLLASVGSGTAAADLERGEQVFRQCQTCHALEEGVNKIGPSLHGVFGRESGTLEGFRYSPAMQEAAIVWDEETIDAYLTDPRGYIPRNRMAFVGVRKEEDRAAVIAYIKANGGDPGGTADAAEAPSETTLAEAAAEQAEDAAELASEAAEAAEEASETAELAAEATQ